MTATTPSSDDMLAQALEHADLTAAPVVPHRPDITPAQIIAGVPVVANLLAAFGVFTMSAAQQAALTDTLGWALALLGADALIRVGRNLSKR